MSKPSLRELEHHHAFVERHIGPNDAEVAHMLRAVGHDSLESMTDAIVPASIQPDAALDPAASPGLALPGSLTEVEALAKIRAIAQKNDVFRSFIGQGYYGTHTPNVILRNILENPAWYTAYTPYQAEISQGRMEALINFQQMCADLTGMDIANASLLDEATAAAEAMTLAKRSAKSKSNLFYVADDVHPQTLEVVRTRADGLGIELQVGPAADAAGVDSFGVLLQYPNTFGRIDDHAALAEAVHARGGLVAVASDLLALTLIKAPGEWGADIVVGNSQRFGVPFGFGGPHAGFMACRDAFKRSMPGRLIGVSVDSAGKPAYRLTLQTREQHIRREKATSNICTAQVLLAVMASMYAVYHGPDGLRSIAGRVHDATTRLAAALRTAGGGPVNDTWFDTLTLHTPGQAAELVDRARTAGINLRRVDADSVALSLDETTDRGVLARLGTVFGIEGDAWIDAPLDGGDGTGTGSGATGIPAADQRSSDFLTHPVFHQHHSETEMLRYLRRLADRDVALDRAMIPLGSCTMKLNATAEMEPISWPQFADIHPYAPADQTAGYAELVTQLQDWLAEITGYAAVSVQPNGGSQGEFAGLLAIKAYHRDRGEAQRDICLIPASAHGTNAASAALAGLRVVVVATAEDGEILLDDLRAKLAQHGPQVAAIMITYPSTHGVYEEHVREVCDLVHDAGGQVYIDGANLNALVGLARPGEMGGDVSHLNLHKTFCIPHGGGGPGVGPVAVAAHLAPYLPGDPTTSARTPQAATHASHVPPVSAAPWGSAGILPISWAYVALMGPDGLLRATQVAVLAANYLATRLRKHFPILYTGPNGLVAHECILDLREITKRTGVTAEDVAKRLMDYGFHAPTLAFPVPGTLMVEPTESEDLAELDRFVEAMVAIRAEIDEVAAGTWPLEDSPLRNAPHTAASVAADDWTHPYGRERAAYPLASLRRDKYFPPVRRIDGARGDRFLVCSCPPVESFAE